MKWNTYKDSYGKIYLYISGNFIIKKTNISKRARDNIVFNAYYKEKRISHKNITLKECKKACEYHLKHNGE